MKAIKELFKQLFTPYIVVRLREGNLYEVKGYYGFHLFYTIKLYMLKKAKPEEKDDPGEWICTTTGEKMGDIFQLSDRQLLRGRL